MTRESAQFVIAAAEREGFVREPSLDPATYEQYLLDDAGEALEWLHERALLAPNGLPWGDVPYGAAALSL